MLWDEKPYHSLNYYLKHTYGEKLYKLALNGGMTCPNRDGTLDTRGCIFCSTGGSGEFAGCADDTITAQIESGKKRLLNKTGNIRYIGYFQAYTNTYGTLNTLRMLFTEAISHPDIAILSIATRPDCLSDEVLILLAELNKIKPVWIELGLQTVHEHSAEFIRRGYPFSCFLSALDRLNKLDIPVIPHVILGLPTEKREQMLETVRLLGTLPVQGIKLQLLHIIRGTDLAALYAASPFPVLSLDEYTDLITDCISLLHPAIVIHRITGDGPKDLLIAPLWSCHKRQVLNTIHQKMKQRNIWQGKHYNDPTSIIKGGTS